MAPVVPKATARRYFEVAHIRILCVGAAMDSEEAACGVLPSGCILPALEVKKGGKCYRKSNEITRLLRRPAAQEPVWGVVLVCMCIAQPK